MHFLHPLVEIRKSCTIPADNFRYNIYLKCSSKNTLYLLSRNHLLIFYIFMLFYTFASIHCILTYFVACILLLTCSLWNIFHTSFQHYKYQAFQNIFHINYYLINECNDHFQNQNPLIEVLNQYAYNISDRSICPLAL